MSEAQTITLAANSEVPENVRGKYFVVLSCSAPFQIEADKGGRRTVSAGHKFGGEPFRRLTFKEINGAQNIITYYAGDSAYEGVVPIAEVDTFDYPYLMENDGSQLGVPDTGYTNLPETITITGVSYTRKSFHVANKSGNQLGIYKSTGELMDIVFSNEARTLTLSGDLKMKGIGGGASIALYYTLLNG